MFPIKARLLEYQKGEYQGTPYATCKLRSADIANGSILKYKIDVKRVPDLTDHLDEEIEVTVDVQRGLNDQASLRIVGVAVENA